MSLRSRLILVGLIAATAVPTAATAGGRRCRPRRACCYSVPCAPSCAAPSSCYAAPAAPVDIPGVSISITEVSRDGDEVCAKVKVKVGSTTIYNQRKCVRLNACVEIYDGSVLGCDVKVEVCASPSQICVKGEIDCGFLGDDDFEECVDLP